MPDFHALNLIRLFDFYLASMFVIATWRRVEQYRVAVGLAFAMPARYPRLLKLVREHRSVLLTWETLRPAALALLLCVTHTLATRAIWPQARLSAADLIEWWPALFLILPAGAAMVGVDSWFLTRVAVLDRKMLEKYFDQAEFWLKGWRARAVSTLTAGKIDPLKMVHGEVRKALEATCDLLEKSLWWTSVQVGLRIAFGLTLWLTWALGPGTAFAASAPEVEARLGSAGRSAMVTVPGPRGAVAWSNARVMRFRTI